MTVISWIFDNLGEIAPQRIADQIVGANGKIEGEVRKLEKGGAVASKARQQSPH